MAGFEALSFAVCAFTYGLLHRERFWPSSHHHAFAAARASTAAADAIRPTCLHQAAPQKFELSDFVSARSLLLRVTCRGGAGRAQQLVRPGPSQGARSAQGNGELECAALIYVNA